MHVFPAYAGMIPAYHVIAYMQISVPRIRGDDPEYWALTGNYNACSPHTRG